MSFTGGSGFIQRQTTTFKLLFLSWEENWRKEIPGPAALLTTRYTINFILETLADVSAHPNENTVHRWLRIIIIDEEKWSVYFLSSLHLTENDSSVQLQSEYSNIPIKYDYKWYIIISLSSSLTQ